MSDSATTPSSSGNSTSQEESNTVADQGDVKNSTASPPPEENKNLTASPSSFEENKISTALTPPPEENKNSTASPPPEEDKISTASPPSVTHNSSATLSTPSAPPLQASDQSSTPPAAPSDSTPPAAPSNNTESPPAPSNPTPPASPSPPSSVDGGGGGSPPAVTPAPGQIITNPPALTTPQDVTSPPSPTNNSGSPSAPANGSPPLKPTFLPTVPPPSQSPGTPVSSKSNRTSSFATNGSSKSEPNAMSGNNLSEKDKAIIGVATAGALLIMVGILFFLIKRSKKRNRSAPSAADDYFYAQNAPKNNAGLKDGFHGALHNDSQRGGGVYNGLMKMMSNIGGSPSVFSYEEVMEMTNGFSQETVIGQGGFGCVFKGFLHDGKPVAVKQLKASSGQGEREFRAEVEIISRVHHRYLVSLVGYCISQEERLLIYEFVPNNNLEHHLHGNGIPVLDWSKRLKIAIGAAKGLAYLHDDCHPKIIHRDIKSANILLDNNFEALVADFGLARLSSDTFTHVSTRVMGTFGYMAPEYASSGKLTDKSDVFSFGVVLLELVTGRKPVDPQQPLGDESLVEWARPLLLRAVESGDFSEFVDPRLEKNYVDSEMSRMVEAAAACIRHSAPRRPRMIQVVRALDSNEELSDLSNGVKYGQSTRYDSQQYNQEIQRFRRVAFDSSEDMYNEEYGSRDTIPPPSQASSSTESDSRSFRIDRSGS